LWGREICGEEKYVGKRNVWGREIFEVIERM
jgi:hypothetical protein